MKDRIFLGSAKCKKSRIKEKYGTVYINSSIEEATKECERKKMGILIFYIFSR